MNADPCIFQIEVAESFNVIKYIIVFQVQTSFHDIDPSHDLGLELNIHGFRPSVLKFPRAETFSTVAKLSATNFSLSENVTLDPVLSSGNFCLVLIYFEGLYFDKFY